MINVYARDPIELKRVSANQTIKSIYFQSESWLDTRLAVDMNYKVPAFAIPTDMAKSIQV